jgi:hypothetical protein
VQSSFQKSVLEASKIMRTETLRRQNAPQINKSEVRNALGGAFKARRFSERLRGAPPAGFGFLFVEKSDFGSHFGSLADWEGHRKTKFLDIILEKEEKRGYGSGPKISLLHKKEFETCRRRSPEPLRQPTCFQGTALGGHFGRLRVSVLMISAPSRPPPTLRLMRKIYAHVGMILANPNVPTTYPTTTANIGFTS